MGEHSARYVLALARRSKLLQEKRVIAPIPVDTVFFQIRIIDIENIVIVATKVERRFFRYFSDCRVAQAHGIDFSLILAIQKSSSVSVSTK